MDKSRYTAWFLGTVLTAVALLAGFNWAAGAYILHHPHGPSVQTLSGFERALKPVWLARIRPEIVFVGSSRVRDAFDPVLLDPALGARTFNYGASSMTPYEARRFTQDALAQPSVRQVVVALDAFTGNGGPGEALPSFDETRLSVTPEGTPTPRRGLWLFTTGYLSGGAVGMNALSAWSLFQLNGQDAAARPDRHRLLLEQQLAAVREEVEQAEPLEKRAEERDPRDPRHHRAVRARAALHPRGHLALGQRGGAGQREDHHDHREALDDALHEGVEIGPEFEHARFPGFRRPDGRRV